MSEREDMARAMHAAVTEKARAERANVVGWDDLDRYYRDNFLRMADGVIAAGWSRGGALFDLPTQPVDRGPDDA